MEHKELNEENLARVEKFQKDEDDERFLESLNDFLASREKEFMKQDGPCYPNLFVFGLPRSGTTLAAQLLTYCLDIGYINNVIARFWKAPLQGIRLSKILLKDQRQTSFDSNYGVTSHLTDSHEFGYFWSRWLGDGLHLKEYHQVQWKELRHSLQQISLTFNRPVLYKNALVGMHLKGMSEICGDSLFILVERDPVDNGISILKGRDERFGDRNHWWSLRPPNYEQWLNLSYYEQIALQVITITRLQHEDIKKNGIQPVLVRYSELCDSPEKILIIIEEKIKNFGYPVKRLNKPPRKFNISTYQKSSDYNSMKKAFEKVYRGEIGKELQK